MESYHPIFYLPCHLQTKLLLEARTVHPSCGPLKPVTGGVECVFLLSFFFILVSACGLHTLQESYHWGIGLSVPFQRWALTDVRVLCVKFPRHSFSEKGGVRFYWTPWDGGSLSGTDLHRYGLVMDGWLQGISEECEPSFSEVRPLGSNTQHRQPQVNSGN